MQTIQTKNALRLLQAADELKAKLAGEFSSVHGLSVNEFFMLTHLDRAPLSKLSRVDLAKRMHVSASTVTRMAAPMEKIGLVGREVAARDARLAYVVLTDAGRTRLAEAKASFAKRADDLFRDRWEAAELDALSTYLSRMLVGAAADLAQD